MTTEPPLPNVSRIVSLTADNIQRLKAVDITPAAGDNIICVGGQNDQGKSSLLLAIELCIGPADDTPGTPVRDGEEKAKIVCDLGEIIVERTITRSGGGALRIRDKENRSYPSPRALLDKLYGSIAFDPVGFIAMKPAQQLEIMRKLTGVNFGPLNAERAKYYEERTFVNREVTNLKGTLSSMPKHPDAPETEVSEDAIVTELQTAERFNAGRQTLESAVSTAKSHVGARQTTIGRLKREVEKIDEDIVRLQNERKFKSDELQTNQVNCGKDEDALKAAEATLQSFQPQETDPIKHRIFEAKQANGKVRANAAYAQIASNLKSKENEASAMTSKIDAIDAQKTAQLAAVKFPVEGLSFSEDGILFNGRPIERAATAQQIRVAVAIAAAMNPKLRVMLVREGPLLDEQNLALLSDLCREFNLQAWVERIGKGKECQIIIEDGLVQKKSS